ncbi:hypothetical protein, partial [Aeromonas caviae]|uniref:hypothetical protein n=1 Tax=Aeromonas caviae TaxID=648 RepID=UPI001CC4546B
STQSFGCGLFCLATNQIAQTGLSSLPPVIYYSEQLFSCTALPLEKQMLASMISFGEEPMGLYVVKIISFSAVVISFCHQSDRP